jgi:hypothetical protein
MHAHTHALASPGSRLNHVVGSAEDGEDAAWPPPLFDQPGGAGSTRSPSSDDATVAVPLPGAAPTRPADDRKAD